MIAVDLFAGAGGFSTGAIEAGATVALAANHWPVAVETHRANHPEADHWTQDLQQADFRDAPDHDVLLASPACQGHSRARGKERPHHDAVRATAWAVVTCAEVKRPDVVVVENVPDFRRWVLYPAWCQAMQALGYSLAEHVIDAADHGVPQSRERLFVVGARALAPLRLRLPQRERVGAASFVDFQAGRWSEVERPGRAASTLRRVRQGRVDCGERFLVSYYGSTRTGRPLDQPVGTITTRDRWAVVDGDRMRMLTADECRAAMGFPAGYRLPPSHRLAVHLLGNAVCPPVARDIVAAVMEAA